MAIDTDIHEAFARHVPEVSCGTIELRRIAREHGQMSYIIIDCGEATRDPIHRCVGPRGVRVKAICKELGEKVNLVLWHESSDELIRRALGFSRAGLAFTPVIQFDYQNRKALVTVNAETLRCFTEEPVRLRLISALLDWSIELRCFNTGTNT